jgi:hypothetical protein
MMTPVTANTRGNMPVRSTTNRQIGPARWRREPTAPTAPPRSPASGPRGRSALPAAIIDRDSDGLAAPQVAQLHAPDQTVLFRAFASNFRFSAPRAAALAGVRIPDGQEYDGGTHAGLRRQHISQDFRSFELL